MNKSQQLRLIRWRMRVLEHALETGNIALTCRHFGISRPTFYKWRARFEEHGQAGLCDRSRGALSCPHATPAEVVSKILYLRQNYHFGPGMIRDYVARYHDVSIATSTVHRILVRHRLNRLPSSQKYKPHKSRWKRYEKQQPGHRVQMDVKFLERIPGTRTKA